MVSQNLIAYYLHTTVTIDGRMTEVDACQRGISLGILEIGFINHLMLAQPDYTISPHDFIEQIQDDHTS